ncbi:hypothetical protein [Sorangium sp. So ce117]|uniref:hypothetical protein n=1 Tax=Sorangium sp. So ce117 TaxID=3133277 RepID=UPI003F5E5DD2
MKTTFLVVAATLGALSVGCEGQAYGPGPSGNADEIVGENQQALGELTCATVALVPTGDRNGIVRTTIGTQASPDWTYNAGSDCPHQYVVEYKNIPATRSAEYLNIRTTFLNGTEFEDITNESDCERSHLLTGFYVWPNSVNGLPYVYKQVIDGHWDGNSCVGDVDWPNSTLPPNFDFAGNYKVRVAARAYHCALADSCDDYLRASLRVQTHVEWTPTPPE